MRPTLVEFTGGERAFLALAAAQHARCLEDPELNHPFSHPGQHPRHVDRLAAYRAEVMGGPCSYSQSCGDQSAVLQVHAGDGDMSDLGERFLCCLDRAADDAELPADPTFPCSVARVHALGRRRRPVLLGRGRRGCSRRGDAALGMGRSADLTALP